MQLFTPSIITLEDASCFFYKRIPPDITPFLESYITTDEINDTLFFISDEKTPSPNGYTSLLFKRSWEIIGRYFIAVVRYFFDTNTLPKCVNSTRIALVPKIEAPTTMNNFRLISSCNVMYKCIYKVIVSRLKEIFLNVIGPTQTAFVPCRKISDVILLTRELMHNYHLVSPVPKCALKINIRKAFDMLN